MRFVNITALDAAAAAANAYSEPIEASHLVYGSVQAVATGAAAGNLYIQASNDVGTPVTWTNVTTAVAITTTGSFIIPKTDLCYAWIRVYFDPTGSDVGTVTAKFKGFSF